MVLGTICLDDSKYIRAKPFFFLSMNQPVSVLRNSTDYRDLYFYQKAEALYQITYEFCKRFLPAMGDRTVDQMWQAARSGKQNIVEGIEDGRTSTEMELKLLNVSRGSIQELRQDYEDYLRTRNLVLWDKSHPRYNALLDFCKHRNRVEEYEPFLPKWNAEEYCNVSISLCRIIDKMMCKYLEFLEKQFAEYGGIKERMHAVRTGRRAQQLEIIEALTAENECLKAEVSALRARLALLEGGDKTKS